MIKEKITYTDYNGDERTETCMFNLSKAELLEMNFRTEGGLDKMLEKIQDTQDASKVYKLFTDIILMSYGEKSEDGKRFIKKAPDGHRLADDFAQSEAYSELIMKLISDADYAANFIRGVVPASLAAQVDARG